MMRPDFIGIGAARCATTWTSMCLHEHPEIFMARGDGKTYFFNRYYKQGLKHYEKFFHNVPPSTLFKGEQTETYLFDDEVPVRIARHYPDVKIIAIVRNPVDRAFSTYLHLVRDGFLKEDTFEQEIQVREKIFIKDNNYYDRLRPYFDLFPRENIHIQLYEDISAEPQQFLWDLYTFVGADNTFLPSFFGEKINASVGPRFQWLNKCMTLAGWAMRDLGMVDLRFKIRNSSLMKSLRFKQSVRSKVRLNPETRERLADIFQSQNEQLSKLIQRDLSTWQRRSFE